MERIAHRELRNNSSEILRRVAAGESFEITNNGEVVGVLSPPSAEVTWNLRIVRPATRKGGWRELQQVTLPPGSPTTSEILDELREDIV
jgi:prevent-host-death family protein